MLKFSVLSSYHLQRNFLKNHLFWAFVKIWEWHGQIDQLDTWIAGPLYLEHTKLATKMHPYIIKIIDILINISVVFQIRVFFCNLLVHVLFPDTSYHSHDQEPIWVQNCETSPPLSFLCFRQSKTAINISKTLLPIKLYNEQAFLVSGL